MNKPREIFHFNPSIQIKVDCMISLIRLEVDNSTLNITEENIKLKLYKDYFDELSFEWLKDELEEILSFSDNSPSHLQHEKRPHMFEAYKKLRLQKI